MFTTKYNVYQSLVVPILPMWMWNVRVPYLPIERGEFRSSRTNAWGGCSRDLVKKTQIQWLCTKHVFTVVVVLCNSYTCNSQAGLVWPCEKLSKTQGTLEGSRRRDGQTGLLWWRNGLCVLCRTSSLSRKTGGPCQDHYQSRVGLWCATHIYI